MSEQFSLWDRFGPLPQPAEPPLLPEVVQADPNTLRALIEERDGVPGILASRFAEWSRYVSPQSFLRHIERLKPELEELFGPFSQISYMVRIGSGARREVRDYFLPQRHLTHALIHTRLPQLRALRGLVTTVFTEYQSGGLISTNAETTIKLLDARVAAEEAMPGITQVGTELARREDALRAAECAQRAEAAAQQAHYSAVRTEKAVANATAKKRQPPFKHATDCSDYIVWHKYRGACPCCQDNSIMSGPGTRIKDQAHWDHWENKVWKRGPYDGWYICKKCNERFENEDEAFRSDRRNAWDNYLGHVRWYHKLTTKLV